MISIAEPPPIIAQFDGDAHRLAFTRKGDHLHHSRRTSGLLEARPAKLTIFNNDQLSLLISVIESGGVDRDSVVE
jgi:hypothetical protein